ncbi:excalibur calcium-binding domain-containing protein [Arthrobacter koreensis]|uniref:excalibur calcium-binding domain-containing protein n=1 Tax=Arthrobacter koreensis TaxID=199136 RepID=UPI002DB64E34|nr:excalibur calcium-binding domain-containing protein [Arthrobacter koreensis]MEB7503952.1 excalibur calcium-binding domain-containing protein [Arthrobacter koreensis]
MKKTLTGLTIAAAFGFTALAASPAAAAPPYANCDAAAAEGVYNIAEGQPGYEPSLDRDGDGIACEGPTPSPAPPSPSPTTTTLPPVDNQIGNTPKGGANTGAPADEGTDATGVLLAAGGVVAVAGITAGLRRKSGNHA